MLEKLVKAGALGFVSFSGTPIDTGKKRLPAAKNLGQSKTLAEIPGTCIHFVDAAEIVEKGALRVRMICEQTLVEKTSQNICARIEGSDKSDDILTVTAHYDSVPQGLAPTITWQAAQSLWSCFYICNHTAGIYEPSGIPGPGSLCRLQAYGQPEDRSVFHGNVPWPGGRTSGKLDFIWNRTDGRGLVSGPLSETLSQT